MTMIEILFFGSVADAMGRRAQSFPLPDTGLSLLALRRQLFEERTDLRLRMSVNQVIKTEDQPLQNGDEVAFFSVFSGG